MSRVSGQLVDMYCARALISLAPMSIWVSAGYFTAYIATFLPVLERRALTRALPIWPAPGDSMRPRAKISSASGQDTAPAVGRRAGVVRVGVVRAASTTSTADDSTVKRRTRPLGFKITAPSVVAGIDVCVAKFAVTARAQRRSRRPGR